MLKMFLETFSSYFFFFLSKNFLGILRPELFHPKTIFDTIYAKVLVLKILREFIHSYLEEHCELYKKNNIRVVCICNAIKYKQLIFRSIFVPIILMYFFLMFLLACKVKWTISLVSLHKHYVVINSIIAFIHTLNCVTVNVLIDFNTILSRRF